MSLITKIFFLFLVIFFIAALSGCAKPPVAFKRLPEKVPQEPLAPEPEIVVTVNGQRISPLVPTLFLLPEESLLVHVQKVPSSTGSGPKGESWSVLLNDRLMILQGKSLFSGKAPEEPGLYALEIESRQQWAKATVSQNSKEEEWEEITRESLLVVVLHPFSRLKEGFIDQFPMGFYPNPEEAPGKSIPKTALSQYLPPIGFIEVTPENQGILVSQHYCLKDFNCHHKTPFPHYMALSPDLLLKLELVTLRLRTLGISEARLTILSGFRTPWYNQTVSGAKWSRHIYGDAVDITLDPSILNALREDPTSNGLNDLKNPRLLAKLIEEIEEETGLVGGLGIYDRRKNGSQYPFIHMDTRGFKARW